MKSKLLQQDVSIDGLRDEALERRLNKHIFPSSILGGLLLAGLCIVAECVCPLASGIGLIMSTCIVYHYFEMVAEEKQRYPQQDFWGLA
jgi:preprotein translocase subunit SecY